MRGALLLLLLPGLSFGQGFPPSGASSVSSGPTVSVGTPANGLFLADAGVISIAPASCADAGVITPEAQTLCGAKTFNAAVSLAGLVVDTGTLAVDATNNRVGIGRTDPVFSLDIRGADGAETPMRMSNFASSGNGNIIYFDRATGTAAAPGRLNTTGATLGELRFRGTWEDGLTNLESPYVGAKMYAKTASAFNSSTATSYIGFAMGGSLSDPTERLRINFDSVGLSTSTAMNMLTSSTSATVATASVPTFRYAPTATLGADDLVLDIFSKSSSGVVLFKVDVEGDAWFTGGLSVGGDLALAGTGTTKITSAASDATMTATVPGMAFQTTAAAALGDLLFEWQDSAGTPMMGLLSQGTLALNSANTTGYFGYPALHFRSAGVFGGLIGLARTIGDMGTGTIVGDVAIRAATAGAHVKVSHNNGVFFSRVTGVYHNTTTTTGNVGTGEDDIYTKTLEANAMRVDGDGFKYETHGSYVNNANTKTLKTYFGSVAVSTVSLPTSAAGDWMAETWVYRTNLNNQKYRSVVTVVDSTTRAPLVYVSQGTLTQTETATIVIRTTAEATTSNDVTLTLGTIEAI